MKRLLVPILSMIWICPLLPGAQTREETGRTQPADRMRELRQRLEEAFKRDPAARIPVAELRLPPQAARRLDADGDKFVTRDEAARFLQAGRPAQAGPRDRSDFTMLNEKGFPLNVNPEFVGAAEAPIADGDMVLGIVLNGRARAYPVNYMNGPTNEVVNDVLGGEAIAPSW